MEKITDVNLICLQVFSKASAAISHEIKNTLSIINENAGLLDDLASMVEQDSGVPPHNIQSAVSVISKQVVRSNVIMKNLNRFAHSADTPLAHANLEETLSLVAALTARQAAMKKIEVSVTCPSRLSIHTYLFPFESLLYLSLCRLYGAIASTSTLQVQAIEDNTNVIISFSVHDQSPILSEHPSDDEIVLIDYLGGALICEEKNFQITLPMDTAEK